jgi:hypothetical protein
MTYARSPVRGERRRVIVQELVSVDGYVAGPSGELTSSRRWWTKARSTRTICWFSARWTHPVGQRDVPAFRRLRHCS